MKGVDESVGGDDTWVTPSACPPPLPTQRPVQHHAPRRRKRDSGSLVRRVLPSPRRCGDGSGCGPLLPAPRLPLSKAQTTAVSQIADVKIQAHSKSRGCVLIEEGPLGEVPRCSGQATTPPPHCRKTASPGGDRTADPRERQTKSAWGGDHGVGP